MVEIWSFQHSSSMLLSGNIAKKTKLSKFDPFNIIEVCSILVTKKKVVEISLFQQ